MSHPIPQTGPKLAASRFAQRLLAAQPELAAELADPQPFTRAEMLNALEGRADDELERELRRLRNRVLLRVMARDLSGRAGLEEVCATMTDLAEVAIETVLGDHDLMVVGMGKLGGRELNVSSDVDLVFLYRASAEAQERYERAGRRLIRFLSEPTVDGFVFRVDMRLRPYGDSGPLACNFEALEQYFITQGREWERYAWLKARPLTGPGGEGASRELDAIVRPFVFRKYLDYGTLGALRALHAEVRRDVERRELAEHVKLGPGGIREIEFIAQALQLVRGGRDAELRVRPTLAALKVLSEKNLLPLQAARELSEAYVFLRNLEHRLQYLDDAQRHDLPQDAEDRARVAAMCGYTSWGAFYAQWQAIRDSVSRHFLDVFTEPGAAPEPWPQHSRLAALRASQRYAALPEESRRRLDRLVPALARVAQATPDPEATLLRGVDLVEAIASRAAYLALLAERPEALERVARMIGSSSWAADYVTRHPLLLDELLDDRLLYAPPDWVSFLENMRRQLAAAQEDTERRMNILREMHQAQVFRLLAQDLAGLLTVEKLADHLSALADLMLQTCIDEVWRDLRGRHRDQPRFAVIGYGKLGGKELGYASDLDIIFLYQDDDERAPEVYARLAQRVNTWLGSRTSSGILFETDLELRPSGASGLLVSSIAAFERYQNESAWVWEHQALTRARYCAGDTRVGEKFEAIRQRILTRKRDPEPLKTEILAMRDKLHAAHPNRSRLFDVKHDAGGMIDIEFAVQFLVLAFSSDFPSLTGNLGNIALLRMAADHGLVPPELAERCRNAYREFRRIQHSLRLNGARYARVPHERVADEVEAVKALWRALFRASGP
ncbi:MAG TPA: bifunctional [glutamate--ammonia ligase]-adenylyl-L-tyrosine phosphorylase/[glutamate--ammonia-ligase] adenylyltransferase [Burkholderiales bacterium]|nr:bifunctional [glutamate--ammonia ligase]-adenylyl-L-tyrosine phosphorylase/[glutamate--ammonia-ligase] adenylyltransferase [Burkholderiales bacterium]